jgi:UDP-glucose 4-epimerase
MSKVKQVVILGHSGFIGSHLERTLSASGTREVIGRSLPDIDLADPGSAARLMPYLTRDAALVLLAAVKRQFGDTLEAFQKNMAIVENVCSLLEEHPVGRVIFLSSAAVYGEETENTSISEETPVNPTSYYGIAKYSAERLLKKTCSAEHQASLICLRPPLIYGPGDKGRTYGPSGFTAAALEGAPITLWGDGTERREFIYVQDICRLIAGLLDSDFAGELNVVSGSSYCFADIVAALKEQFPNLEVNSRPRSKQKADNAFDARRIKSLLAPGFRFTSLKDRLSRIRR